MASWEGYDLICQSLLKQSFPSDSSTLVSRLKSQNMFLKGCRQVHGTWISYHGWTVYVIKHTRHGNFLLLLGPEPNFIHKTSLWFSGQICKASGFREFLSTQNCCCGTELGEPQRLQPVGSRGVPLPPSPAMHLALENMKYFPSFPLRTCIQLLSNITLTPAIK